MIILAPYAVNMHCHSTIHGKAVKYMWDHLCAQVTNLLSLESQFNDCVWTVGEVDYSTRQSFVERCIRMTESLETVCATKGFFKGSSNCYEDIFRCVVVVN
jgi:hypothetical protein